MNKLYIVATPIGNLEDITYRAVKVLTSVDLILAEDTRRAKILLDRYNIKTPVKSYHQHSKSESQIVEKLKEGAKIAYISDAGTPGISDPGQRLISAAISNNIKVEAIPGPAAVVCALSKYMRVEVCRDGNKYFQEYSRGKPKTKVRKIGKCKKTGTTVIFEPDPEIFEEIKFDSKKILNLSLIHI